MPELVNLTDVEQAHRLVGERVHRTPTLSVTSIGDELGLQLWLKAELFQRTGSFKLRGVLNALLTLPADELRHGVVSMSAGNHAAALALGATAAGTTATVVMPAHASEVKVAATRRYGGTVVLTDRPLVEVMGEIAESESRLVIHPFDDPRIIAGAGGVGLEFVEDAPPLDLLVVPVGGGGLISGIAAVFKERSPATRVVGVEPHGADGMTRALAAGAPVTIVPSTLADGLAAPFAGDTTFPHVRELVDEVVTIDDGAIGPALRMLYERAKLAAEPSAAAPLAALLCGAVAAEPGSRVGLVVSGGNVDLARLPAFFD
ncbi:MAG: threo-3-hydroxy-L-aspartate ammonia-lyase [Frankiaceae bacterium]|nr:threo-3-hydroxy-L-aspartate ammonia-lyase [Frankiaceae bacterium]